MNIQQTIHKFRMLGVSASDMRRLVDVESRILHNVKVREANGVKRRHLDYELMQRQNKATALNVLYGRDSAVRWFPPKWEAKSEEGSA